MMMIGTVEFWFIVNLLDIIIIIFFGLQPKATPTCC